ncbi:hypothetical protein AAG906_022074 [Vitis piasezkii]
MINPKDDANQGNDLLLSLRSIFHESMRICFSAALNNFTFRVSTFRGCSSIALGLPSRYFGLRSDSEVLERVRILVFGGDATTNRVLQAFCDMELHPTLPIGLMPLGTQVNISISLGWVIQ